MKKFILLLAVFTAAAFTAFAQPANDDCINAFDISSGGATIFTTVGATMSAQTASLPDMNDDDVWFSFIASSTTTSLYKIEITSFLDAINSANPPPSPVMELWSSCGGTGVNLINTQNDVMMAANLTQGATYYVRVYTNGTAQRASFHITVKPISAVPNDDCSTATTLTPVTSCTTGEGPFTTEGATQSSQASGDGTGRDDDVWFKFTTGATDNYGKVALINPVYNNLGHGVIELWANCGDASNTKFFPLSNSGTLGALSPNTTYYIRIYTYGSNSWIHSFNICVTLGPPPPANDSYFTAAPLTLNGGIACTPSVTGATTAGATAEFPNDCNGHLPNDVWYKFTATSVAAHIEITNKTLLPGHVTTNDVMWIQVFDGSNTSPVFACTSSGFIDFTGATALTIGHTYFVRIYNDDPGNACSFNLCTQIPPPPAYDECSKAVNVNISNDENCTNGVQISNSNATASSADGNCIANVGSDVWLKFTASGTPNMMLTLTNYLAIRGSSNALMGMVVYSGSCGSLTSIACVLGKVLTLPALTAGQVYYIRIISFDIANAGNFTICLHPKPDVPPNISCATAIDLPVSADASVAPIHATTTGLPDDNTLTDCNGNQFVFSNAMWFKFTAAATDQLVDIENVIALNGGVNVYLGYKLYTGDGTSSCTGIVASTCANDVSQQNNVLHGLVIGNTYFLQVLINHYNGDDAGFNIRVIGTTAPPNDEPAGAVTVIENPFYKSSIATQGTFRFSTITASPVPLAGTYGGDVWYKFIAATATATLRIDNGGGTTRTVEYNANPATGNVSTLFFDPGAANAITHLTGLVVGKVYYIRVYNPQPANSTSSGSVFGVSVFGLPSTDVADVATPGANCTTVDGPVHSTNSNKWLHITDQGKLVVSIFDGHTGQPSGLGTIGASYYINSGTIRSTATTGAYLDRNFGLTPALEPAGGNSINLVFYFSKEEFDRLVAANADINFLNDLGLAEYTSLSCSDVIANGSEATYNLVDYGAINSNVYYFEVAVTHLSAFYLRKLQAELLPVTCTDFTYLTKGIQVQLNWKTASETNSSHFDVQRSNNSADFTTIGTVDAAGTSSTTKYYSFSDIASKAGGTYYYRLKQFDKDGHYEYVCKTLKVVTGTDANELFGKIYPNPAVSTVTVNIQKNYTGKVSVQVINVMGQVLSQKDIEVSNNTGQIIIPTANLAAGVYTLRFVTKEAVYTKQFSKVQ